MSGILTEMLVCEDMTSCTDFSHLVILSCKRHLGFSLDFLWHKEFPTGKWPKALLDYIYDGCLLCFSDNKKPSCFVRHV